MCRYAEKPYKSHFVCLKHRVSKKGEGKCHVCREPLLDMGRDFHPPRKNDDNQWRKLEILTENGTLEKLFDSCGCDGPGPRPNTLAEAKQLLRRPDEMRKMRRGYYPRRNR